MLDGPNVVQELDGFNATAASYIEGVGIDEHLARADISPEVLTYVTDPLGTVRKVVHSSGQTANDYTYTAYGSVRREFADAENPYYFTGRRRNIDTGESFYRARYYQPDLGGFASVDPLSPIEPRYAYARNNPVLYSDPSGTFPPLLIAAGGALLKALSVAGIAISTYRITSFVAAPAMAWWKDTDGVLKTSVEPEYWGLQWHYRVSTGSSSTSYRINAFDALRKSAKINLS